MLVAGEGTRAGRPVITEEAQACASANACLAAATVF